MGEDGSLGRCGVAVAFEMEGRQKHGAICGHGARGEAWFGSASDVKRAEPNGVAEW